MAPKRKTSKPPSSTKKQKISEAASRSLTPDYSNLPLATLTQIVSYLNKKDDCLKPISETCQKFKVIALDSGRLKLCLDFNRITDERNYPKVSRSYKHLRLIGDEIMPNQRELGKMLKTSKNSAETLEITGNRKSRLTIKQETFVFIGKCLPNLNEISLNNVNFLLPELKCETIDDDDLPEFANLKKLVINGTRRVIPTFKKVTALQDLVLLQDCYKNADMSTFISSQRRLEKLRITSLGFLVLINDALPELRSIEFVGQVDYFGIEDNNQLREQKFLNFAPNLENVKIHYKPWILMQPEYPNPSLRLIKHPNVKAVKVVGSHAINCDLGAILVFFPKLTSFKSHHFNWTKN